MDKNKYMGLVSAAVIVEGIITYAKTIYVDGNISYAMIASIVLGITITIAYKIDLLEKIGLKSKLPFIGSVLTGILISRGSNIFFDIISNLNAK